MPDKMSFPATDGLYVCPGVLRQRLGQVRATEFVSRPNIVPEMLNVHVTFETSAEEKYASHLEEEEEVVRSFRLDYLICR